LLDPAAPLQDLLRLGLVLPEIRGGGTSLETRQFLVRSSRFKDGSADRQRAC
jgi:hypothetical protein